MYAKSMQETFVIEINDNCTVGNARSTTVTIVLKILYLTMDTVDCTQVAYYSRP